MIAILELLAEQLHENRRKGSLYLVGDDLTAADIYWASFSNLVAPMRHEHCPMPDAYRAMGEAMRADLGDTLDRILIEHRDAVLDRHVSLPLQF